MHTRFKMITVCLMAIAASLAASAGAADTVAHRFKLEPVAVLPASPDLGDYVGYALGHNEELAAVMASQQAVLARSEAVGSLPDPRLTWSEAIEPVETRVGPQDRIFTLSQQIPWFGTLGLQKDVVDDLAASASARIDATALAVMRDVRGTYYELTYLERALTTTAGHLALLVQYESVARSRYETGEGSYADVVKAQVELAQLEDRLAELRDRRRPLRARFNATLGRPAGEFVNVAQAEPTVLTMEYEVLQARLLNGNPDLAALGHDAESQLKSGSLASKSRYPGLSLGVNYIQIGEARTTGVPDSGKDAFLFSLGVSIPLWQGSYRAAEREAEGRYQAVQYKRSDLARQLSAQLEQAVFEYRDASRRLGLYRDTLLPKARQSLAAARSTYEAGDASFLALIDAERVLLEFELAGQRAASDLMISLAEIDRLVAEPVQEIAVRKED